MVAAATSNWVPTQLGRYEVLGELATGGMAQILLARLGGPSGFERTVVIKRILPHLARDKSFVAMFLDEARIVGGIHHPNVVQVHELCRDDDELYLVMEYLEGESLFGIMRRMQRLERGLPYELSAYVLAEACDGLHSAHELTGPDGKTLNLVHRDVSPHNIFVTYRGAVKVIDFGIAKTDNRKNRTETGQLKGKFEYMSPEQCAAEPCDRRTDVYALGIVLYELITGRRLFKRKNELLTIKAVTEAPIIPPTILRPDCPGQLEQIVMRALERDPARRFQDCAEMRRELLRLLRQDKSLEESPEDLMVKFMTELFSERIDEKKRLIEVIAKGSSPKSLPPPEVDLQYTVPEIDEEALQNHTHMRKVGDTRPGGTAPGATVKAPRPDAGSSSGSGSGSKPGATRVTGSAPRRAPHFDPALAPPPVPGVVMPPVPVPAAAAETGRDAAAARSHSGHTHPGRTQPGAPRRSPWGLWALLVGAAALVSVMVWIQLTPSAGEIRATEAPSGASRGTQAVVTLSIDTQPPGADVWVNGSALGPAPVSLAVAQSNVPVSYEARLSGHAETFGSFVPNRDEKLTLTLSPLAAGRSAAPAPAPGQPPPSSSEGSSSRRSRSRGARSYHPPAPQPAPQTAPAAGKPAPAGDPFRRFD